MIDFKLVSDYFWIDSECHKLTKQMYVDVFSRNQLVHTLFRGLSLYQS